MSITEELAAILGHVDRPGDFYATGRAELLAPKIEVEALGQSLCRCLPLKRSS